jgi:hypothetical protein
MDNRAPVQSAPVQNAANQRCYVVEVYTAGEESVLLAQNNGVRTFNGFQQALDDAYCAIDNEVRRLRGLHARLSVYYERPTPQNGLVARIMNDGVLIKRVMVNTWVLAPPV